MSRQINPPFDASEPCAACQMEVRNISALIHNFLTRCDVKTARVREGKAMVRLNDLRRCDFPTELNVPSRAAEEVVAVGKALADAVEGMVDEGLRIKWTPEILARVEALIPRAAAAEDAFNAISNAHFADRRHSSGEENVLREARGSRWAGFVNPDYAAAAYDHRVEVVSEGGDIRHTVCDTRLVIDAHFKEFIAWDRTFYGKVYCPTCVGNVPFAQFEVNF